MSHEPYEQPSTSTGNTDELTLIKRNGGLVLLRAGYQYTKKRENRNGWCHWRCVKVKDCSGSLQIKDGNISNEKSHMCQPNDFKNIMDKELHDLRETVLTSDFAPVPRIFNTFKSNFIDKGLDLVNNIPSFEKYKSKLYDARNMQE